MNQLSLTPQVCEGLQEISHGRWEGLTRAEVEERFGDEYRLWEADPFTFACFAISLDAEQSKQR